MPIVETYAVFVAQIEKLTELNARYEKALREAELGLFWCRSIVERESHPTSTVRWHYDKAVKVVSETLAEAGKCPS